MRGADVVQAGSAAAQSGHFQHPTALFMTMLAVGFSICLAGSALMWTAGTRRRFGLAVALMIVGLGVNSVMFGVAIAQG